MQLSTMVDKMQRGVSCDADKCPTKLDTFLAANGLRAIRVAREAKCSRQHLYRLRKGISEPTRPLMVAITRACSKLAKRRVRMLELFVLEEKHQ